MTVTLLEVTVLSQLSASVFLDSVALESQWEAEDLDDEEDWDEDPDDDEEDWDEDLDDDWDDYEEDWDEEDEPHHSRPSGW
jgi:hypothetical protein